MLRLDRLPDAGGVVLRGGMLLRHWFRPTSRRVLDLDLVANSPLAVADAMRFRAMFSNTVADGVTFDVDGIEVEGIWLQSDHPGIRLHVRGTCEGSEDEIQVDVTGGPPPTPAAVMTELPTSCGVVRLWTCRPESVVGQKLQALWHLGMQGWRPKDLDDLRLLLDRMPMDETAMIDAIRAAFAELGGTGRDARRLFAPDSWWQMKHASARWSDYIAVADRPEVRNLSVVVAKVAARLKPILEDPP
ncbi:MAG: nucleotidyl transferase AbiEii/AbiGii toxin family protein [Planctomycetaceae bacterium]